MESKQPEKPGSNKETPPDLVVEPESQAEVQQQSGQVHREVEGQENEKSAEPGRNNKAIAKAKQKELNESEMQRVKTTLEQLESVRQALSVIASEVGSLGYGPDQADQALKSEWLPQATHIVNKYLDVDQVLSLILLTNEHVMRPVLKPTYDMMDSFKQMPAREDWVERYRNKLSRINQLIVSWQEKIRDDPARFITSQKAFSIRRKTELNLPLRAILFVLLLTIAILFIIAFPPIAKFAAGFTNPQLLLGTFGLLVWLGLSVIFLQKKELWSSLFLTVLIGLLPYFCAPIPKPETTKRKVPKDQKLKPETTKPPSTQSREAESEAKESPISKVQQLTSEKKMKNTSR